MHLKINPYQSIEILKDLSFSLMVKRLQRLSQVDFSLSLTLTWIIDILFEKLTPQVGRWIWKTPSAHYASGVGDFM